MCLGVRLDILFAPGDYRVVEIPSSIPNLEVKHHIGDDTTPYWRWESSSLPGDLSLKDLLLLLFGFSVFCCIVLLSFLY